MGMNGLAAERLIIGTAVVESRLHYLKQFPEGPALGIYQMEGVTHDDIWKNYLHYRPDVAKLVSSYAFPDGEAEEMIGNLYYATAMCRLHYRRVPAPLPDCWDEVEMAKYWKEFYNTPLGKGTVEKAKHDFAFVIENVFDT